MATIGPGWVDGAWIQASWATSAWGETAAVTPATKPRRGAPNKRQYTPDRYYLPPHRRIEDPLPHELALREAREELAEVRRIKAVSASEIKALEGSLGSIARSAKVMERRIEEAKDITAVAARYTALGQRIEDYTAKLDIMVQNHRTRLRHDDDAFLEMVQILMDED